MPDKKTIDSPLHSAAEDIRHAEDSSPLVDSPQSSSPAYRLAYNDRDFLLRDELRPIRLGLELTKPELTLQEHQIEHTVVIFGSARIPDPDTAATAVVAARRQLQRQPDSDRARRVLAQALRREHNSRYYQQARELAGLIASDDSVALHVVTGGGPGIMEAANRGAREAGAKTLGMNIVLPAEQRPNRYISPELCFRFHYFAMRKMHFLLRARALVVFPGGYGTLDELFETLTLVQTGKSRPMPVIMFGREFWQRLINFDVLVEEGMVTAEELALFQFVDTPAQAWQLIRDGNPALFGNGTVSEA